MNRIGLAYDKGDLRTITLILKYGKIHIDNFELVILHFPKQTNGNDCGVCVLQCARYLMGLDDFPNPPGGNEWRHKFAADCVALTHEVKYKTLSCISFKIVSRKYQKKHRNILRGSTSL